MRIKKAKNCSKVLATYSRCFGLNYKNLEVFLDHTFVRQAIISQVNIYGSLCNLVGKGIRLVTSSCVITECKALGSIFFGALKILEGFTLLKCNHLYKPSLGAAWCIRKRIRTSRRQNSQREKLKKTGKDFLFGLASNDEELRNLARSVPGMPIFFIAQRCVTVEPIPESVKALVNQMTEKCLNVNSFEVARLQAIEEQFGLRVENACKPKKRSKGAPNPLSCRKKPISAPRVHSATSNKWTKPRKRRRAIHKTWVMRQVLAKLASRKGETSDS